MSYKLYVCVTHTTCVSDTHYVCEIRVVCDTDYTCNRHILHPPHTIYVSVCSTFMWLTHTCTRTDTYTPLSHVRWCSCPPPLSPSRDRTCTRTRTGIKGHDSSDDTDTAKGKEEEGDAYIGANGVGILGGGM